jgi:hypothetical protein
VGGFGLDDVAPRLRDAGLGAGTAGGILSELRLDDVAGQLGQDLALRHRIAFLDQHLGDAVTLDLRSDQDFLARHECAGDDRLLGEFALDRAQHRDRGSRLRRLRPRRRGR